jgi:hypothetical protein
MIARAIDGMGGQWAAPSEVFTKGADGYRG